MTDFIVPREVDRQQPCCFEEFAKPANFSAFSKDAQPVGLEINLSYHKVSKAADQDYGSDVVNDAMKQSIDQVLKGANAWDIYNTTKDPAAKHRLEAQLNRDIGASLRDKGVSADGVEITKVTTTDEFSKNVLDLEVARANVDIAQRRMEDIARQAAKIASDAREAEIARLKAACEKQ